MSEYQFLVPIIRFFLRSREISTKLIGLIGGKAISSVDAQIVSACIYRYNDVPAVTQIVVPPYDLRLVIV